MDFVSIPYVFAPHGTIISNTIILGRSKSFDNSEAFQYILDFNYPLKDQPLHERVSIGNMSLFVVVHCW